MTIAQELDSQEGICQDVIFPPGDLYSDEPPLESELHLRQIILFLQCLEWLWRDSNDFYAAGNLTVYYSPHQRKSEFFRGPDFFVVLGTERKTRKSWVVWEEDGKYPNVIVEILSDSTANTDKGLKKTIYQDTDKLPKNNHQGLEPNPFFLLQIILNPLFAVVKGYLSLLRCQS